MQDPFPERWQRLMAAIQANDGATVAEMAAAGLLEDLVRAFDPADSCRRTPLMLAYWWGRSLAAAALVKAGSLYEQPDSEGNTAAWYARRYGRGERELLMGQVIDAAERRISMEKVIEEKASAAQADPSPAGKRRRSDI